MGFFSSFYRKLLGGKEVNVYEPIRPVRTWAVGNIRIKKKVLLLYRVDINRDTTYAWWMQGHAYVLAFDAERAGALVKGFAEVKGYPRVYKAVSVCGKRTQRKIKVVTKDNKIITLSELVAVKNCLGVIAFSSCRESIQRCIAYEVDSGHQRKIWA